MTDLYLMRSPFGGTFAVSGDDLASEHDGDYLNDEADEAHQTPDNTEEPADESAE